MFQFSFLDDGSFVYDRFKQNPWPYEVTAPVIILKTDSSIYQGVSGSPVFHAGDQ